MLSSTKHAPSGIASLPAVVIISTTTSSSTVSIRHVRRCFCVRRPRIEVFVKGIVAHLGETGVEGGLSSETPTKKRTNENQTPQKTSSKCQRSTLTTASRINQTSIETQSKILSKDGAQPNLSSGVRGGAKAAPERTLVIMCRAARGRN